MPKARLSHFSFNLCDFGTWLVVLGHGAGVAKMVDSCVICRRRDYLIFPSKSMRFWYLAGGFGSWSGCCEDGR
jgi:hypothetical protein